MRKMVIQTSDPIVYIAMLRESQRSVKEFCVRNGVEYREYIGVRRGSQAFHATFNRIPMLCDLMRDGYDGWVIYIDADCVVKDLDFDLDAFLVERSGKVFIAATGGDARPWAVNAGVFMVNLGSVEGRYIVQEWGNLFAEHVTQDHLDDPLKGWSDIPNDQDLLHQVLRGKDGLMNMVDVVGKDGVINYHGSFITQALRAHHSDGLVARMAFMRRHNERLFDREIDCVRASAG